MSINNSCVRALIAALASLLLPAVALAQHEAHNHAPAAVQQPARDIIGTVLCADGPPLPGAIVQLFAGESATKPVASALSDNNGNFRLRAVPNATRLQVSYLGHVTYTRDVVLSGTDVLAVGIVRMQISAIELDALTAAAERAPVQLRAGATVVEAAEAATAAGGSVADVLKRVPNVELDADGRITMRGNSGVLVLINGRKTMLREDALAAFLKQMPASALERIEAGTATRASLDADGNAGVVNLVFKDGASAKRAAGYALSASAATAGQYSAAVSANGSAGDAVSWTAAYALSAMQPKTDSHTERTSLFGATNGTINHQRSGADAQHLLHSVNGGLTARLNASNSVDARLSYSWMRGNFDNVTHFADERADGGFIGSSATSSVLEHTIPQGDAAFGWQLALDGPSRFRLSTELALGRGEENFNGRYASDGTPFLTTRMGLQRDERYVKSDATFDAFGLRLETGVKQSWRVLEADYDVTRDGASTLQGFRHEERISAGHFAGSGTLAGASMQAGVRVEASRTDVNAAASAQRRQLAVFPSVQVKWPHDELATRRYQASYSRRILRPEAAQLNPFSMGEDDMNAFIGNPGLVPEITDQLELSIEQHAEMGTLQLTPFVRTTSQPIRALKAVTESGRATTSLTNLRSARSAGFDAALTTRLGDRVNALLSSSLYYNRTAGDSVRSSGIYFNLRAQLDYRIDEQTSAQLYAYRRSAQAIEQGEIRGVFTSDIAVVHRFGVEGRSSLTLRVADPFNTNRLAFHLTDPAFVQHSERKVTSRMVTAFFSWAVGGAPAAQRREVEAKPQIF